MFELFRDRASLAQINGIGTEYVVVTRLGRTNQRFAMNNIRKGLLIDNTIIKNGDRLTIENENYLVVGKQRSFESIQCQLYKTNAKVNIVRVVPHYNNGTKDYDTTLPLYNNISTLQDTITANSRLLDPGLLPNTVKKFLISKLDIKLKDRIILGTDNYMIEGINDSDYENLLYIQCSIDTRVTK